MRMRRLAAGLVALVMLASTAWAEPLEQELARVLKVDEVSAILRDEGVRYGTELEADMLGGQGGRYFQDRLAALYDADAMGAAPTKALAQTLNNDEMQAVIDFFDTKEGQRILTLENAGRVAMADPAVEDLARATYQDLVGSDDPHLVAVERFIETNDLIERNVTSGLDSNYHFLRGLVEGGGAKMGEREIASEVWAQEDEMRADTTSWIYGFLLMAYQPLTGDTLQSYSDFSASVAGQALNKALFIGFEQIYNEISYELGLAVAQAMNGSDI